MQFEGVYQDMNEFGLYMANGQMALGITGVKESRAGEECN